MKRSYKEMSGVKKLGSLNIIVDAIYLFALVFLFPWIWRKLKQSGFKLLDPGSKFQTSSILFRAASVGEISLIKPLVEYFQLKYPIAIICNTQAGVERAKQLYKDVSVGFAPLDFSFCVNKFYKRVKPRLVILVEQELWPNFIFNSPAPVALINARFKNESIKRYVSLKYLFMKLMIRFSYIHSSNSKTRDFLSNTTRYMVDMGNLKADAIAVVTKDMGRHDGYINIVLANTHDPEEDRILSVIEKLEPQKSVRICIVPRHINRVASIERILESKGLRYERFSGSAHAAVVLVDKIGVLSDVYRHADIVVMGGTFVEKGGHNFLEAAAYGLPIVQGPHFENFYDETFYFQKDNAIILVHNFEELEMSLRDLLVNKEKRTSVGLRAVQCLKSLQGINNKISGKLEQLL